MINFQNALNHFQNVTKGKRFAGNNICEDYYWGEYSKGNIIQFLPRVEGKSFSPKSLKNDNVIIILAESPHTNEFVFKNKKCIGFKSPLHRCDKRIQRYFRNHAYNWFDKTLDYDIVIVNAIQYQCSFGIKLWGTPTNQKQRDSVFEWIWEQESALDDLLYRIDLIVQNKENVVLLNCCTAILKKFCNSSVFFNNYGNKSFLVFDEKHPSMW